MFAKSYLYVPADRPEMVTKARGLPTDAVILDLEDAVAPSRKAIARVAASEAVGNWPADGPQLWVRVDPEALHEDLDAAAGPRLAGIVLAKATPALVDEVDRVMTSPTERTPDRAPQVIPLVETAEAIERVSDLASARRVLRLAIGEVDLCAELGLVPSDDESELVPLRLRLVVASAARGLERPVGPVSVDVRDVNGLASRVARLLRLGYGAAQAVHPAQLETINQTFTPTPGEVERARRVVALYQVSLAEGRGAVLDDDGQMIDRAVIRGAREILGRAGG